MALSPDGETVVSGSADENIKFWKVFPPKVEKKIENNQDFLVDDLR